MSPHPIARLAALALAVGAGLAACAHTPTAASPGIDVSPSVQTAVLAAARKREPAVATCAVGWVRPISATESAIVFTCMGRGGPYEGAMYYAPSNGTAVANVARVDRRPAFTHTETSGDRTGVSGQYEIISGVVNRGAIDAMTVGYADGSLGMMEIGQAQPRMYAFVHVGTVSRINNITAYVGNRPAFVFAPQRPSHP